MNTQLTIQGIQFEFNPEIFSLDKPYEYKDINPEQFQLDVVKFIKACLEKTASKRPLGTFVITPMLHFDRATVVNNHFDLTAAQNHEKLIFILATSIQFTALVYCDDEGAYTEMCFYQNKDLSQYQNSQKQ